jgi:hypothetical protein
VKSRARVPTRTRPAGSSAGDFFYLCNSLLFQPFPTRSAEIFGPISGPAPRVLLGVSTRRIVLLTLEVAMTTSTAPKTHTDSTDRTQVLPTAKTAAARPAKAPVGRFGSATRRLLNTLMRSLANPHV